MFEHMIKVPKSFEDALVAAADAEAKQKGDRSSCANCGIKLFTDLMNPRVKNCGDGPVHYRLCDDCNKWSRKRDGLDDVPPGPCKGK